MTTTIYTHNVQFEGELSNTVRKIQRKIQALIENNAATDPVAQQQLNHMNTELQRVEAAKTRLNSNQFGICQMCEKSIPLERLEILPYAEFCKECQEKIEEKRRH